MRLYVTTQEAEIMVTGTTPPSVVRKVEAKLKPPLPMRGQTDILTALAAVAEREVTK